ncbi:MAG: GHKL domain-containing protein [Clostridia bacterium]|nr:GHKL domain-containing protein [Clostridia bacterium]
MSMVFPKGDRLAVVLLVVLGVTLLTARFVKPSVPVKGFIALHTLLNLFVSVLVFVSFAMVWFIFRGNKGSLNWTYAMMFFAAGSFFISFVVVIDLMIGTSSSRSHLCFYFFLSLLANLFTSLAFFSITSSMLNSKGCTKKFYPTAFCILIFILTASTIYLHKTPHPIIYEVIPALSILAIYLLCSRYVKRLGLNLGTKIRTLLYRAAVLIILAQLGALPHVLDNQICHILTHLYLAMAYIYFFRALLLSLEEKPPGKLCLNRQFRDYDQLYTLGEVAAATVHEIRNPLTTVKGFLQIIQQRINKEQDVAAQDLNMYTTLMLSELDRTNCLLEEFLLYSRPGQEEYKVGDLRAVVNEIMPIVKNQGLLKGVEVHEDISDFPIPVHLNPHQMKQVLLNLTTNAFDAMEKSPSKNLNIYCGINEDGGKVILRVSDTGTGIGPEIMGRIFDPFFSTKMLRSGTGLGLAVVNTIIRNHGGRISVESCEGKGTHFIIELPHDLIYSHNAAHAIPG